MMFIVVTVGDQKKPNMKYFESAQAVLDYVVRVGKQEGDPRKVVRIFSVSETMRTRSYNVVFNGTLELVPDNEVVQA